MRLYFSNRFFWTVICLMAVMLSCAFLVFAVAVRSIWLLGLLALALSVWLGIWAYRLFFQPEKLYLELGEGHLIIHEPFTRKETQLLLKDIKHMQHMSHQLRFILADVTIVAIRLNYMSQEDIKKLLLYFKYVPNIGKKMI